MTLTVYRGQQAGFGNQSNPAAMLNTLGQQVIMEWRQKAILDGSGFQIRAGTITTPITGDGTALTDSGAEMAADAAAGTTIIPVYCLVHIETPLDTGEGGIKSCAVVSNSGSSFTPLALRAGSATVSPPAAVSTARVQGTGLVLVPAEAATTTIVLRRWFHLEGTTSASEQYPMEELYAPLFSPVLDGARTVYVQVALDTYMAHLDYIELDSTLITR